MEEKKPLTKKEKFCNWCKNNKAMVLGGLGVVGGSIALFIFNKKCGPSFDRFVEKIEEDDSVIITPEHEIEYEGKRYNGFSIMDSKPLD